MSRQSTICPPSPSDSEDDASMLETLPSETMVDLSSNEGEDENTSSTTRSQRSQSQKTGYRNARQLLSDSFSKDLSTRVDDDSSDNDDGDQQQRKKSVDLSTRVDDDSSDIDEDDRQPDKEGTPDFSDASSSSSEETDNDNDTQIGFRFVEGRDWDYYKDEPVLEIFQSGIDMLTTLVANRSFRFRSAKTDHERSFGILDRIRIEFRPSTGKRKTQKRDLLIKAILKEVRYIMRTINWDSQNLAWNKYAVQWCFSSEGLAWMTKLNKEAFYGNQAQVNGLPDLKWREDLSEKTQKLWTSAEAVETVLENIIDSVRLDDILKDGKPYGLWGEIAQAQTFRLIRQQCAVIFLLMRTDLPSAKRKPDDYITMFSRHKQGRPAKLSAEFFAKLDERIGDIIEDYKQPSYTFPTLRMG